MHYLLSINFRENGGLSPNTADNESGKSTEAECDYNTQRRNSGNKLSPYSEEGRNYLITMSTCFIKYY